MIRSGCPAVNRDRLLQECRSNPPLTDAGKIRLHLGQPAQVQRHVDWVDSLPRLVAETVHTRLAKRGVLLLGLNPRAAGVADNALPKILPEQLGEVLQIRRVLQVVGNTHSYTLPEGVLGSGQR